MRFLLNIIWLVLCGIWMAIAYAVVGLICFLFFFLVITIPFGIAAFRIAGYVLWPFGRTVERRGGAGVGSVSLVHLGVRIVPSDRVFGT